eukprot:m.296913 g.296913  ORF g.296913 m.296913 type:complete len:119 (+) comp74412_c0_seq1:2-358(+)
MKTYIAAILFAAIVAVVNSACVQIYQSSDCTGEAQEQCLSLGKCGMDTILVSCNASIIIGDAYDNSNCDGDANTTIYAVGECVDYDDGRLKAIFSCSSAGLLPSVAVLIVAFVVNRFN